MTNSSITHIHKRRAALRMAGLRPIQLWVPDTRRPSFALECRRQSSLLRNDMQERELLNWIEAVTDVNGWE
ncbi:antitoxin MazE family protein [Chromatium okenii]|jgi:hypothetical protein|uniref:antitoxin MazE family protein n=2 Tax=Chromatium okenii TaxID=61644 RepID=UPI0026EDCEDE|nr:antitoxin MazE family protein [Chromatium okenii]MBV5309017.1 antitoxin MazE family protein [Chromatium okenii]